VGYRLQATGYRSEGEEDWAAGDRLRATGYRSEGKEIGLLAC
jgi:hypothetical protein